MKRNIAALLIAAIVFPQNAIAVPVVSRDPLGNVIIGNTGIAPGTLTLVDYNLFPKVKSFTTGLCNLLTIKSSSTFKIGNYVQIGTTRFNLNGAGNFVDGQEKACTNGVLNAAYPWATNGTYKWAQNGSQIIISGATGTVEVSTNPGKERLLKTDSCGRLVIRNSEKWKIEHANDDGELGYKPATGGSYWTLVPFPATATTLQAPHICYKKTLYKPL